MRNNILTFLTSFTNYISPLSQISLVETGGSLWTLSFLLFAPPYAYGLYSLLLVLNDMQSISAEMIRNLSTSSNNHSFKSIPFINTFNIKKIVYKPIVEYCQHKSNYRFSPVLRVLLNVIPAPRTWNCTVLEGSSVLSSKAVWSASMFQFWRWNHWVLNCM